jgi:hypothetical protein
MIIASLILFKVWTSVSVSEHPLVHVPGKGVPVPVPVPVSIPDLLCGNPLFLEYSPLQSPCKDAFLVKVR